MSIPKIIHQTIKDKRHIHPALQDNIRRLQALNPGWEHRLYDNADVQRFVADNYAEVVVRAFKRINPVYGPAVADFFRYLLLYQFGGVYLDVKSTAMRPLDEVITTDDYLLSRWNNAPGGRFPGWGRHAELGAESEFQQWHIVSPPAHPFLKAAIVKVMWNIDRYTPDLYGTGKDGVLRVTGPIAYTLAIAPIRLLHQHLVVDIEDLGFVYSVTGGPGRELSHENLFPDHYRNSPGGEPIILR